jgi:DNA modification methylase
MPKKSKAIKQTVLIPETEISKTIPNNKLNDLSPKEWIKFLKSWFIFDALASDLKEERGITKDTMLHPATFSPTMISEFIKFFTKKNMVVLDPFVGIGTTLVACDRTGRIGYGIELNPNYAETAQMRISEQQKIFVADVRDLKNLGLPKIDFCITSPPYGAMLHKIDVNQLKRIKNGLDTKYSDMPQDLGNITNYDDFLNSLCQVFDEIYDQLNNKAYVVVILQNVINKSVMLPLAWEFGIKMTRPPFRYILKKEKIWCQDKKRLHPFGYPAAWVSNTMHHYCLVFRKEE